MKQSEYLANLELATTKVEYFVPRTKYKEDRIDWQRVAVNVIIGTAILCTTALAKWS